jgi:hypothetical protein
LQPYVEADALVAVKGEQSMRSFKALAAAAVAIGLVAAAPAAAGPPAHAAGSDAPTLLPSIVNVRVVRVQAALERATEYVDTAQADKAVGQLLVARTQLRKAWEGAKYVVENAPPVAAEGAVGHTSGAPVGASPYADQYTTAYGVISLQHDVASAAFSLADGATGPLLASLSTTVFSALNSRDAAITYIHSKDTAPAGAARKSDAVLSPWASAMAPATSLLDDELMQIDGTLQSNKSSGLRKVLNAAEAQDIKTQRTLNKYWPPAPAG